MTRDGGMQATRRVYVNEPARCVQEGDLYHGVPVIEVYPGRGQAVWIRTDDGRARSFHKDELVMVGRAR